MNIKKCQEKKLPQVFQAISIQSKYVLYTFGSTKHLIVHYDFSVSKADTKNNSLWQSKGDNKGIRHDILDMPPIPRA